MSSNDREGTTVTVVNLQKQSDWIKVSILQGGYKKQHVVGRFINGVLKWSTCNEIKNMCVIKLEYDESLINIKKNPEDFDTNNHDGTSLVTAWPLHF